MIYKCECYAGNGECKAIEIKGVMKCIYSSSNGNSLLDLKAECLPVPYPGGNMAECYIREILISLGKIKKISLEEAVS